MISLEDKKNMDFLINVIYRTNSLQRFPSTFSLQTQMPVTGSQLGTFPADPAKLHSQEVQPDDPKL